MTIRRLSSFAALVAVLALAACGSSKSSGPSAEDARTAYAPVKTQISKLGGDIGAAVQAASNETDAKLATQFAALTTRGRAQAAALGKLDLPASATDTRDALQDALRKGSDDLSDITTAARASDAAAAHAAAEKLVADSQQIETARAAFEKALAAAK